MENQSNSPTSPASSPYSSQSLESETAGNLIYLSNPLQGKQTRSKYVVFRPIGPSTTQELIRRSMPNLNNQSRMRLPQPSGLAGNLNRQHGSDSGLRPPSMGVGIRPPICSTVNGSSLVRPQFKVPQPPPQAQVATNNIRAPTVTDPVRPSQLVSWVLPSRKSW